jgi:hypothetical protein
VQYQELDPSVEVTHLRRLLDRQPVCLMRLGADGTVLAANDAALALLGVASGAQALGQSFVTWVPPDQRERWQAFAAGVVEGGAASIECEIHVHAGERLPTLFQAVPLTEHPDGIASMAVAARAVARQHQLEADLETRSQALAAADAARRAAEVRGARALADVRQLEIALEAFAARQQQAAGDRNGPELERLAAMLENREAAIRESEQRERDAVTQRDALQARLKDALASCEEREASLRQLETAHADLAAAHAAAAAEHDRLMSALREQASRLGALANGATFGNCASAAADGPAAADAGCEEART